MTQDTKADWGAEIPVNGKRPGWLKGNDEVLLQECGLPFYKTSMLASEIDWHSDLEAIRLPADHPHYAQHRDTATIPRKGSCRNCAGTGWVCENHGDYPWAGVIGGVACCGGAGAPCGVCNHFPGVRNMVTTLSDDLTARMATAICRHVGGKSMMYDDEAGPNLSVEAEFRAIVAEMEPVDGDLVEARKVAEAGSLAMPVPGARMKDDHPLVQTALAAIKRGRALERGEGKHG